MRKKFTTLLTVLGAATVLVLAANSVTYAATGRSLILGAANKSTKVTTLKRTTPGAALQVKTTSSTASPFVVNGTGKVANLNADLLDGLDSSALTGVRAAVYHYTFSTKANVHTKTLPALAPGVYLATFNVTMNGAGGTQAAPGAAYCEFDQSGVAHGADEATPSHLGWDPMLNLTTVISTANGAISLYCSSVNAWTTTDSFPAEVTFTKLDGAATTATVDPSSRVAAAAPTAPAN